MNSVLGSNDCARTRLLGGLWHREPDLLVGTTQELPRAPKAEVEKRPVARRVDVPSESRQVDRTGVRIGDWNQRVKEGLVWERKAKSGRAIHVHVDATRPGSA
jgi:hypothetical protein